MRMVLWCYSGTLMYTSLYGSKNLERSYGDVMMYVRKEEFQRYAEYFSDDVLGSDKRSHRAGIAPAQFNLQRFTEILSI